MAAAADKVDLRDWAPYSKHKKLHEVNVRRLTRKSLLKFCTTIRKEMPTNKQRRAPVAKLDLAALVKFAERCQGVLAPGKRPPGKRGKAAALPKLPKSTSKPKSQSTKKRKAAASRKKRPPSRARPRRHSPSSGRTDENMPPRVPIPRRHTPAPIARAPTSMVPAPGSAPGGHAQPPMVPQGPAHGPPPPTHPIHPGPQVQNHTYSAEGPPPPPQSGNQMTNNSLSFYGR